jgi:peroxiredoxin
MIYAIKRLIKPFISFAFVLFSVNVNAQVSFIQNTINKLESYKNFSYQSVNKQKELFTSDTIIEQHNAIFVRTPENKNLGYLFNIETLNENDKFTYIDLYNGQNLIHITPQDSTYKMQKIHAFNIQGTLPGCLQWIRTRLEKKPSKIVKTNDTTINANDSYHLIATVYDTIINKKRNYTDVDLFIDKLSGMPDCIIIRSTNTTVGDGITNYYSESRYFDYKFNQDNINIASITVPKDLHPPKEQPVLPKEQTALLALWSVAPSWTLYDTEGKKMSLTQMKGKVVLLDFFFIGCWGCMEALKPLNNLHEKYKNQNVAILSISNRDSSKNVVAFKKRYNIKNPMCGNAANVANLYHVTACPAFYFIDKEGKIAKVFVGYDDDFEKKVTAIIDDLLKNKN